LSAAFEVDIFMDLHTSPPTPAREMDETSQFEPNVEGKRGRDVEFSQAKTRKPAPQGTTPANFHANLFHAGPTIFPSFSCGPKKNPRPFVFSVRTMSGKAGRGSVPVPVVRY